MLNYFDLLLDLLEINNDIDEEKYRDIAKYIIENKEQKYLVLHRYHFVFNAFLDLVLGRRTLEEFFQTGDLYSNIPLYKDNKLYPFDLESIFRELQDSVVILDQLVWNMYSNNNLKTLIEDNNIVVLYC